MRYVGQTSGSNACRHARKEKKPSKTLINTQGKAEAEALFEALANTLAEIQADNFLRDSG